MTSRQYEDCEGDFFAWNPITTPCRGDEGRCPAHVSMRSWESRDGAYEDYQFRCDHGHTWWVDGIDA